MHDESSPSRLPVGRSAVSVEPFSVVFVFLYIRAFRWARLAAVAQVSFIVWGWALVQYPFLIRPDVTAESAVAPAATLRLLIALLGVGALVLFPALVYLFSLFDPASPHNEA